MKDKEVQPEWIEPVESNLHAHSGSDQAKIRNTQLGVTSYNISDFSNANHTHESVAEGGTLRTNAIVSGTFNTARLGSGTANNTTFLRGDSTWAVPSGSTGQLQLLKQNSGTSTNAAANNLDTLAMASGLTDKDTLKIYYDFYLDGGTSVKARFWESGTTTTIILLWGTNAVAVGEEGYGEAAMSPSKFDHTVYNTIYLDGHYVTDGAGVGTTRMASTTVGTPWTGNWTLAFRSDGIVGGGTLYWKWAVYRVLGQ